MITTRDLRVEPPKGAKLKQRQVTTKTVDASIRVEPPKEPIKKRGVSTTSLPDVADIAEKKRRDDIMAEVKKAEEEKAKKEKIAFEKGDAVYQDEKGGLIVKEKPEKSIEEVAKETDVQLERKAAMKERMAKVRAAKKKKAPSKEK